MKRAELANLVRTSRSRVFGAEYASNDAHRAVLGALIDGFDDEACTILCEPSLARHSTRPPDVALVDLVAGVHVIECKGITLDQIESLEPGGNFRIRYEGVSIGKNPFAQVRNAMFDVKDAVQRAWESELLLPFRYWVVLATVTRNQWHEKWGDDCFCPPELLFADDLPLLAPKLLDCGRSLLQRHGRDCWPTDQIQCVWRAFGDSSVLFPRPEERPPRRVAEGTLGDLFDEAAETYKALSDEQQKLSTQLWENGPRLVRGVAGSGKTIVLANNLARRVQRVLTEQAGGSSNDSQVKIAVVCFNRTLVPFLTKKIDIAFRQRTGGPLPGGIVEVWSYNRLMYHLSQQGLWRYQKVEQGGEAGRANQYLRELMFLKEQDASCLDRCGYDAIYVDEGQDFCEEDFRLLKELCRGNPEPSLFVFYDDAQNLYGRRRPNWHSLGLNVVGRSTVMSECFRNTHEIIEPAFNVLYGKFASDSVAVPTRAFGDVGTLQSKQLLREEGSVYRIGFAKRHGMKPKVSVFDDRPKQWAGIVERLRWLTQRQLVRPEDIHVLVYYKNQVERLVAAVQQARLPAIEGIHIATERKDDLLHHKGWLSVSTVASAKGYDAYCVLIAGGQDFPTNVQGRASFYVACSRAIEYLEVFATQRSGLVLELERAVESLE